MRKRTNMSKFHSLNFLSFQSYHACLMKVRERFNDLNPLSNLTLLQAWIYHCHLHPLQAANCSRNSRLVVDEDDLMWVANEQTIVLLFKKIHENFR